MKSKIIVSVAAISVLVGGISNVLAEETVAVQSKTREELRAAAGPEILISERLGSGTAVDLYRVSCTAECIQVDVKDTGPNFDTRFKMEINGSSPAFLGNASAFNPPGGKASNYVEVCSGQNVNQARRAYISFSEVNAVGPESYNTLITCRTAGGGIIGNVSVVKVLDQ